MSDSIEDLVRRYKENVLQDQHPRSIGLFTIPEYPELEANRGMWSVALDAILTTLRYLAPATLLTLFWVVFSSEEQKQSVLKWLAEAGPVRVEHLDTVWRHGWVLCGVLDAALPGACAGHPPTRLSLKHAQAIADHYLGVEPVFSRQELESNDSLSRHQEWKLATYLDRIRQALSKLTPPVSKPVSQRTSPETTQFTLDYVAKGSGLSAAQVNHKASFKIYPTAQQALDPGEITILIRGPRDTYGMTVLPPILGKAQMIRQKLLGLQSKQNFTENVLPITQGATYLRSYGKNDMNKTYYIPKTRYDIEIDVEIRTDHAKISYVVNLEGKYLISITSRGQSIVGSPFTITASHNIINILEKDNYCLEDGEEIDIVDVKTDRKVVLRIVDFVTEKMLLKENGTLEKISDDEARILMATDTENDMPNYSTESFSDVENSEKVDREESVYIDPKAELMAEEALGNEFVNPSSCITINQEELSNMGPAEREIWQTCNELKIEPTKVQEEQKPYKWEIKRPTFTPIIEESDRSISSGTKDIPITERCTKPEDGDNVSVAFAELNEMYQEYFPNSETSSTATVDENDKIHISQPLRIDHDKAYNKYTKENKDETQFGEATFSNIVLEKKKYWDEKIRQIEAKSAETSIQPKKKRISAKQLKHDSLSKRKGKQILKNFLNSGDYSQVKNINQIEDKHAEIKPQEPNHEQISADVETTNEKLVERWKKYWDEKLETDQVQDEATALKTKSPSNKVRTLSSSSNSNKFENPVEIKVETTKYNSNVLPFEDQPPVKQELPEEVFKAFETSPKRFFGTSRKQILNKIDTFLGKPGIDDIPTADVTGGECHESGLVSSRISLFHNLSNTEPLPWARRKSQSLQNVSQRISSNQSIVSSEENLHVELIKRPNTETLEDRINEATNYSVKESVNLKNKRARMVHSSFNKTLDETIYIEPVQEQFVTSTPKRNENVRTAIQDLHKEYEPIRTTNEVLRKKSFSKSEMDIFNKIPNDTTDDGLDKYKSCDELPKINVKNFISLYESVTKTATATKPAKRVYRNSSADSQKNSPSHSIKSDAVHRHNADQGSVSTSGSKRTTPGATPTNMWTSRDSETVSNLSLDTRTSGSFDVEVIPNENKETTYLSLSDIELEIIECNTDKSTESSPERETEPAHLQYKNRFKMAKEFFQSIEELREVKKPRKLNECEQLLRKESTESVENDRPQKRVKKNIKSHSMPSSEISKIWNELQENRESSSNTKLVKISEKFNVEDLFTDVTEGKLSRQGSLRGIPHKKAVLEAFRSMENVADTSINSYELPNHRLRTLLKNTRRNAQTYLSEYPYLPTTDPSKYHSRLDVKASGLISLKELKERKPRRNSVPDLRLNPKFTVDL
nr:unnamed protein product [Spodoptera littoralis]